LPDASDALIAAALAARENAFAPYSKFRVGAAIEDAEGRIHTGCNVENATYGLTVCAERVAVFKAISEGVRKFRRVAVAADGHGAVLNHPMLRVFGDNVAGAPDPVGRFAGEGEDEEEKATDTKHRRASGRDLSDDGFRFCRAGSPARFRCRRRIPRGSGGRRRRAV
jgi:hypothetical protein